MFSRFINLNLLKSSASVVSRCLLHSQSASYKRPLPVFSSWIYKENNTIKTPPLNNYNIDLPNVLTWIYPRVYPHIEISKVTNEIIAPSFDTGPPKEAVRIIVIRKKKMKKHKLRKLRKKMKFEWGKRRQRREFNKERAFQATLIQQCKEAEAFSAEKYVDEKLQKLHEVVIPRYWKGKRLPEYLMRQKLGLPPK